MNDIELKLKLAKELPELISVVDSDGDKPLFYFKTIGTLYYSKVREREWDWVVNHLLSKQENSDIRKWLRYLADICGRPVGNGWRIERMAVSTWQKRAEAYFKVKQDFSLQL